MSAMTTKDPIAWPDAGPDESVGDPKVRAAQIADADREAEIAWRERQTRGEHVVMLAQQAAREAAERMAAA